MMAVDVKRLSDGEKINLDRCYAESDRQRAVSRRTQALLAAAGMDGPEKAWFVLRVRQGQDKAVDKALKEAKIERWMPTVKAKPVRRGGRAGAVRPEVDRLAFPGYLFVRMVPDARGWAGLKTVDGVAGILGHDERPLRVADKIILNFQALLAHDENAIATLTKAFRKGDRVCVMDGPFASFPGIVQRLGRGGRAGRALVEVLIFGRVTTVELDLAQIDKSY